MYVKHSPLVTPPLIFYIYKSIPACFTHQVWVNKEERPKRTSHPNMVLMTYNHNNCFHKHDKQQHCLKNRRWIGGMFGTVKELVVLLWVFHSVHVHYRSSYSAEFCTLLADVHSCIICRPPDIHTIFYSLNLFLTYESYTSRWLYSHKLWLV